GQGQEFRARFLGEFGDQGSGGFFDHDGGSGREMDGGTHRVGHNHRSLSSVALIHSRRTGRIPPSLAAKHSKPVYSTRIVRHEKCRGVIRAYLCAAESPKK